MGVQVTGLTLNKKCHEKEFIDFEFDGKHISEFGMVAVADGGRHSFDAAPTFQDETSSVNGVDGQYYWGTHFGSKKMSFTLATDGMTEAQINQFKIHFQPGKYGKFIEDKLACRYGYARISSITTFNTVPFKIRKKIAGTEIDVNEYKGDCKITFEFDDPKMYATEKIIENLDQYGLRALYVNGTPHAGSFKTDNSEQICFYGEKNKALSKNEGIIEPGKKYKFLTYYNPSTYQTKPIITMDFTPQYEIGKSFPKFLIEIADEINSNQKKQPYNEILTTSSLPLLKQENALNFSLPNQETSEYPYSFRYTTPNIIFQINKSISIAFNFYETNSTGQVLELEEKLRLEITNSKVMAWAASALSIIKLKEAFYNKDTGNFLTGTVKVFRYDYLQWHEYFNLFMLKLLAKNTTPTKYHLEGDNEGSWQKASYTITFNSQENRTYMTYRYNRILTPESLEEIFVSEEDCGDMILSEYLNLDGGDVLNEDGSIASCHYMKFTKDGDSMEAENLSLEYVPTYF